MRYKRVAFVDAPETFTRELRAIGARLETSFTHRTPRDCTPPSSTSRDRRRGTTRAPFAIPDVMHRAETAVNTAHAYLGVMLTLHHSSDAVCVRCNRTP